MIKMMVLDVDGTLTDGKIYIGNQGEVMKAFNVKDGLGIKKLIKQNIIPVIITGRYSEIVNNRAKELSILEVHQNIENKIKKLKEIAKKYNFTFEQIAYIGDDENDLECMKLCKIRGCPANAIDIVKDISNYICFKDAGNGAVREFIDYILHTCK